MDKALKVNGLTVSQASGIEEAVEAIMDELEVDTMYISTGPYWADGRKPDLLIEFKR